MKYILSIVILFQLNLVQSQITYQPLKCVGEIPDDFLKSTREKVLNDIKKEAAQTTNKNVSGVERNFFLESNFLLNDLLLSGSVLFGDSLTNYVNKVADVLLENDKELRSKIRFYVVKSTSVNAFATDPGMIFVTVGLMAKIKNEAQLAFVLAHEIIHFKNRHIINSYVNEKEIAKGGRKRTTDDKIRMVSNYSKENELEADSLGFILFSKSKYNYAEAAKTMDMLQFSHLPFEEIKFDVGLFENSSLTFDTTYRLRSIKPIDILTDEEDDTYSSHPNIKKRRTRLNELAKSYSNEGKDFILDKELFSKINNLSRKEFLYLESIHRNYVSGFYNAYVLNKMHPGNVYYSEMMTKFLYGMAKYKNRPSIFNLITTDYNLIEGESQASYYFFLKLSDNELCALSALKLYQECQKNKSNTFLARLRDDIFSEFISQKGVKYGDIDNAIFEKERIAKLNREYLKLIREKDSLALFGNNSNNTSQINTSKKDTTVLSFAYNYLLVFSEIYKDFDFKNYFESIQEKVEKRKAEIDAEKAKIDNMSQSDYARYEFEQEKLSKEESKINLDKIIVVDPYYFEADSRKGLELLNSEDGVKVFNKNLRTSLKAAKVETIILSTNELAKNETDKFNDIAALNAFYENSDFVRLQSEYITEISKKYDTRYINYSGLISIKIKRTGKGSIIFFGLLNWPFLPIAIGVAFTPIYVTYYDYSILDLETQEIIATNSIELKARNNNGYVKSQIYDQINQLKK